MKLFCENWGTDPFITRTFHMIRTTWNFDPVSKTSKKSEGLRVSELPLILKIDLTHFPTITHGMKLALTWGHRSKNENEPGPIFRKKVSGLLITQSW